jgi:hypothetical protein
MAAQTMNSPAMRTLRWNMAPPLRPSSIQRPSRRAGFAPRGARAKKFDDQLFRIAAPDRELTSD